MVRRHAAAAAASLLAVVSAALLGALSPAEGARPPSPRTTFLLSRALDGGIPNGPSRNPAVSHDQRIARVIAFESEASDIVERDLNGLTDVFAVHRGGSFGTNGTPWEIGRTELVSRGRGGAPANGRSYAPAVDGDSHTRPSCVAFVSEASNLVRGDTNRVADAFVRDLRSGRVERVSVDSRGRQANGASYEVSVDGDCERVAFTSGASNLALSRGGRPAWRSARTTRARRGVRQVYVHVRKGKRLDRGFAGLTFLASASGSGRPGNGDSYQPAFARAGKAVVFTSKARNLARGDRTAGADVYKRGFERRFQHLGHGRGVQSFSFRTTLVSATRAGRAGNGASTHPTASDDGRYVAYETLASNLAAGDTNGVSDVLEADTARRRPRQATASRSAFSGLGNGPSRRPQISGAGEFVLFDSEATNLRPSASVRPDPNGVRDVFLWNRPTANVSLESRDSDNGYLSSASQAPATSSRGNYVAFESADPLIDVPLAQRLLPELVKSPDLLDASAVPELIDPDLPAPQLPQAVSASGGEVSSERLGVAGGGGGTSELLRRRILEGESERTPSGIVDSLATGLDRLGRAAQDATAGAAATSGSSLAPHLAPPRARPVVLAYGPGAPDERRARGPGVMAVAVSPLGGASRHVLVQASPHPAGASDSPPLPALQQIYLRYLGPK